ncbi:MAG: family 78 glycoside hydrolase catalytic domain [Thermoguttaceae bacterium]|nr:family 78 glycoside hydrolase catalytic domain [Thermoguttaceae bacterium]
MRKLFLLLALATLLFGLRVVSAQDTASETSEGGFGVTEFLVDQLTVPEGIDTPKPEFSWKLDAVNNNESQSAYQLKIIDQNTDEVVWDSGKVQSDQQTFVPMSGDDLKPATAYAVELTVWNKDGSVCDSISSSFSTGLWETADNPQPWKGKWIGMNKSYGDNLSIPAIYLSKSFTLPKAGDKLVKRATAYIAGLGYYELCIDGIKVGDHLLDPVVTQFNKRVSYNTYDVTDRLVFAQSSQEDDESEESADTDDSAGAEKPANVLIGVVLGSGWFYEPRHSGAVYAGLPRLLFQLEIEYSDGSSDCIVSDESWMTSDNGPIVENNLYDGELYDSRKAQAFDSEEGAAYTEYRFGELVCVPTDTPAVVMDAPKGKLVAQMMPPMRTNAEITPLSVNEVEPGRWIYDFGQNFVGWCRLMVSGEEGTEVSMRFAETLKEDGQLYMDNLRGAKCCDRFILGASEDVQFFEPRFTSHGFRYVELTGYPGTPDLETLTGCVVGTDLDQAGLFECSNPTINAIIQNVEWGTRGNYLSMPTDCPQRDERCGWQGDRAEESKGEMYLFDNITLYRKWMQDIEDTQNEEGNVSDVAPATWNLYNPNVTWPSAMTIVPDSLYQLYGDTSAIAKHYDSRKAWLKFLAGFIKEDGTIDKDNYGDWCVPPEDPILIHSQDPARKTDPGLLATAYYIYNLKLMAKDAKLLGKPDDEKDFLDRAAAMTEAFNKAFYDAEKGCYSNGTQTSSVLPLAFDLVPEENKQKVFDALVNNIENVTNRHIGTGLIGGQWLNRVLSDFGRIDLAYQFSSNRDYPSWGYMIEKGATTIWELWNGDTADPAMNSGNHVMLVGDLAIWYFEYLAGIKVDQQQPGFKHFTLSPSMVGDLEWVSASYDSVRGLIEGQWRIVEDQFTWVVNIPVNSTATVSVPTSDADSVRLSSADGEVEITDAKAADGRVAFELGSGLWKITAAK